MQVYSYSLFLSKCHTFCTTDHNYFPQNWKDASVKLNPLGQLGHIQYNQVLAMNLQQVGGCNSGTMVRRPTYDKEAPSSIPGQSAAA